MVQFPTRLLLIRDEARWIAANVAKLPELDCAFEGTSSGILPQFERLKPMARIEFDAEYTLRCVFSVGGNLKRCAGMAHE
jgi:hypothetical protein